MIDIEALQHHIIALLQAFLKKEHPDNSIEKNKKSSFIIGLSGGADSVFLLRQLIEVQKKLHVQLIVAHLQHDWRGEADIQDAIFCRSLAATFSLPFITATASSITLTKKWNGSLEEQGRLQRHAFLQETMHQQGAVGIILGHQAQDQQETFFIRLLRGAALQGLCGMKEIEGSLIRPLLQVQRKDIEMWLTDAQQAWCHDADNDNPRFLRNRIRHELLPLLRVLEPRTEETFVRTQKQLRQEQELIEELVQTTFMMLFNTTHQGDLVRFKSLHPMLQGHVIKKLLITQKVPFPLSEGFIKETLRFLNSPRGGTHNLSEKWALTKKASLFWLSHS